METQAVRFEILGPLRARRGADELDLGSGKQRAVLATLLVEANRPVTPTQIIDAVWRDDPPANGTNVVQKYVAGLRQVLEPNRPPRSAGQLLTLTEAGYRLSVAPGCLDADAFADQVRRAQVLRADGELETAALELQLALSLWRAEPLAGLTGPVFDAVRNRLAESRAAALETLAEIELDLGHHDRMVPELVRLVGEFPLRERPRYLLMLALYRCGRQAEALAAFRDARKLLVEEFGVEPGDQLQKLHQRILQNDPALLLADAPSGPPITEPRPPEPAPVPTRRLVQALSWLPRVVLLAIPILTLGMGTCLAVGCVAIMRRSLLLAASAAGYLALAVIALIAVEDYPGAAMSTTEDVLFTTGLGLSVFGGTLQLTLLLLRPPSTTSAVRRRGARARREQARQFAGQNPALARDLGIGRPDLPRQFDDGGLVDVNTAPANVLAAVPGMTPLQAALIVADRQHRGPFASVEDLVTRGLLPSPLPGMVREMLIVLP